MSCPKTHDPLAKTDESVAWTMFEHAIDAVVKSGPQHRSSSHEGPKSFVDVANNLRLLLDKPGCPSDAIDSAARLIQRLDKCLFVKPQRSSALVARDCNILLQPSDLFLRYVAAFRAGDWPLVSIIEHEAIS